MNNILVPEIEKFIESIRPEPEIRYSVDVGFSFDGTNLEIFEIRPRYNNPAEKVISPVAKAKYVKAKGNWKIYWKRANGNWDLYKPHPGCSTLKEFFTLIEEDELGCFWG